MGPRQAELALDEQLHEEQKMGAWPQWNQQKYQPRFGLWSKEVGKQYFRVTDK